MKKTLSIILALALCICLFAGCNVKKPGTTSSATPEKNVVTPLPETIDVEKLEDCTVSVAIDEGDFYLDDNGKMVMKAVVYSYELYDMVDIASLEKDGVIVRQSEEIKIEDIERLDSGLVRINGGEENGGFDLISNDDTVYYETGMSDTKAYYELGEVVLPVSTEFVYIDESDLESEKKEYYPGDFLSENGDIKYDFTPYNTSVVIEKGNVVAMKKVYTP